MRISIQLSIFLLSLPFTVTFGQDCASLLSEVKDKLSAGNAVRADFTMHILYPDKLEQTQAGTYARSGDRIRVDMEDMLMISDGQTNWLYLRSANEVQINDAEGQLGVFRPERFISMYEDGEFLCDITSREKYEDKELDVVECKPADPDGEFIKARMTVDRKSHFPYTFELFERSGTRYTLTLENIEEGGSMPDSTFVFDPSRYPDIWVEDLRLD